LGKRIVFFLQPEAFCGLKYAENATAAGALARTPLCELTTLPRPSSRLGSGHPSPYPTPLGAFGASMLAPSAPRSSCPADTKSWRRRRSPQLFKVKLRQWLVACECRERHVGTVTSRLLWVQRPCVQTGWTASVHGPPAPTDTWTSRSV